MDPIRVLIIDSEAEFAAILTNHLNSWGFAAFAAADDGETLEIMEQIGPEVVVLGIEAKGKEELHTLERIRANYPEVPLLLLAGKGAALTVISGIQRGAFDVLALPIELGVLCEAIHRARRNRINNSILPCSNR
ncbi:MAG: response regulator [Desulfobulbus sp.]|nr:response regulator [Desulfobulbus sp.]